MKQNQYKMILSMFCLLLFLMISFRCSQNQFSNHATTILTIGDSNGEGAGKWPDWLQQNMGKHVRIINNSVSGRTVGFDNLGKKSLNTLKQIDTILAEGCRNSAGGIDRVLICLGTNDCKAVFDERQEEVPLNYQKLIQSVLNYPYPSGRSPKLILISPPPYGSEASGSIKYKDGDKKVKRLVSQFRNIAEGFHCQYIDIYTPMLPDVEHLTLDGVHFSEQGYRIMAGLIQSALQMPDVE
ncbi:hypothetical protein JW835_16375 [bacterium]|nr:hypothetical protein [bacterium]